MISFITLLLLVISVFAGGRSLLYLMSKKGPGCAASLAAGSFMLFFVMLFLQVIVVKAALPFAVMKWGGAVFLLLFIVVDLVLCRKRLFTLSIPHDKEAWILFFAGMGVFLLNVISIELYEPYFGNDMTLEETVTILASGRVCANHPATGAVLQMGMSTSAKLNFMPGLYAMLCGLTGADAYTFVCRMVPVWGLLLNYAAVERLLYAVFGAQDAGKKCAYGMILYGVLLLMGDYQTNTYAFRILHQGWNPQVILCTSGIPLLLSGLIRGAREIGKRRRKEADMHEDGME